MAPLPPELAKAAEKLKTGNGSPCVCGNLRMVARAVTQIYDAILRPVDLTVTQLGVLGLAEVLGPTSVHLMAERMTTDRTTLTRNLKPLQRRGLIKLVPGEDRRERHVVITGPGRKLLEKGAPLWQKAQERITKKLGQERVAKLVNDLCAVQEALQEG